jgi:hypothetical protein
VDAANGALIRSMPRRIIADATMSPHRPPFRILLFLAACLAAAPTALGDEAILRNGRTLSITNHRLEGDRIVLMVEGGGEITLMSDLVVAVRPDPAPPVEDPAPPPSATPASARPTAPPGVPEATIRMDPGAVFDRDALLEVAGRIARRHRIDEKLVRAVIEVESRYDAFAVSPRGAMGLMQLMPKTAQRFSVRNAFDPIENIDGGVRYLGVLLARYEGRLPLALAAYNAGEEAVDRFGGVPPYRETEHYVGKVLRLLRP